MPPFPVSRYLVPATPPELPSDVTRLKESMTSGVPHAITIAKDTQLVIIFPTGLGTYWRDADPTAAVLRADTETTALDPGALPPEAGLDRPQLYLQLREAGRTLGCAPVRAGGQVLLPDNAGGSTGVQYQVWVTDFALSAGTVRGSGDYGSSVSLAWRRADAGVSNFGTPPVNLHLIRRLLPRMIESWPWFRLRLDRPLTIQDSVKLRRMPIDVTSDLIKL